MNGICGSSILSVSSDFDPNEDGLPLGTHFPLFLAMAVMKQDIDDMY